MPTLQNGTLVTRNRTLYALQVANAVDLHLVDLSAVDTLVVNDTAAGATTVLTLPKIGSSLMPIGHRLAIRKASTVAQSITITPTAPDVISASPAAAYPSPGASNAAALPASVLNSVTIEAMAINVTTGVSDPTVSPTVGGFYMIVESSVASV